MVATGALRDADADAGGATTAMAGAATSKTVQHVTRTIAAADIPNPTALLPAVMGLTIKPTATLLGTDDVSIHRVWLEYTKITNPG
jgi:autotransporter translocation and assembly factor TamB